MSRDFNGKKSNVPGVLKVFKKVIIIITEFNGFNIYVL